MSGCSTALQVRLISVTMLHLRVMLWNEYTELLPAPQHWNLSGFSK